MNFSIRLSCVLVLDLIDVYEAHGWVTAVKALRDRTMYGPIVFPLQEARQVVNAIQLKNLDTEDIYVDIDVKAYPDQNKGELR